MPTWTKLLTATSPTFAYELSQIQRPAVETIGIASLRQQLLGLGGIINRGGWLPVIFESVGNDAIGRLAGAQKQRLAHPVAIEREIGRLPHPQIVPRRFRVPLLGEVDPARRLQDHGLQAEPRRPPQLLGKLTPDRVGDVNLAAF